MSTEDNSSNIEQTIPSTTEIIQKAQEQQQNQQPINNNNDNGIAKRTIEWVSQPNCGACEKQEEFFNNVLKPQSDVPIEITKVDVSSERGQQIADERNLKYTPFYEHCIVFKDPNRKPECTTGNDFNPKNWKIKLNETTSTQ